MNDQGSNRKEIAGFGAELLSCMPHVAFPTRLTSTAAWRERDTTGSRAASLTKHEERCQGNSRKSAAPRSVSSVRSTPGAGPSGCYIVSRWPRSMLLF